MPFLDASKVISWVLRNSSAALKMAARELLEAKQGCLITMTR